MKTYAVAFTLAALLSLCIGYLFGPVVAAVVAAPLGMLIGAAAAILAR